MEYFDERGISRKYEVSLHDNIWKSQRNASGFWQRFKGTFVDNGNTIIGVSELSKDDRISEPDLQITYTRIN